MSVSRFGIKSILISCLFFSFVSAEAKKEISESKENCVLLQPKEEKIWRLFGSVGFGAIFGVSDDIKDVVYTTSTPIKKNHTYDRFYFEVNFGTEFVFKSGNGFNILLDLDNQSLAIGANYLYEFTGKNKYAFITGLDIGK